MNRQKPLPNSPWSYSIIGRTIVCYVYFTLIAISGFLLIELPENIIPNPRPSRVDIFLVWLIYPIFLGILWHHYSLARYGVVKDQENP